MRPIVLEFPNDVKTFRMDYQFMLGEALLVKPVPGEGVKNLDVYIPAGLVWYDYWTFKAISTRKAKRT